MAAKMWSAATTDGREIFADEVAEGSSLICKYCGAGVCYVPPHVRENRGNTYWVRGYFRLLPKSSHEELVLDSQIYAIVYYCDSWSVD
ncbi:hypothetical protein AWB68_06956 [Caballeronia choica]|uniref:Uncharacterized protein n=1 Tax=Caballeronia choica TaxID=326476 RepID=A0A158KQX4_9BURK|nr:hypothetical protein AWB68_06956 [Caballeronia choica]